MKNLAESDSKLAYTAGIGINMVHLHIDFAGVMSSGSVEVEGTEYPEKGMVSASLGLLF
ncbi:MAG: hypothetical protein HY746_00900 [Elusimicrobia bacterium]|nr:hypothetical protein [Elusimicrobiota bacterium]